MARMPRMARTLRMARWLADYPDPIKMPKFSIYDAILV